MRNVRRALVGVTATFALGAGIVGTTTGSAAAYTGPSHSDIWALCKTSALRNCDVLGSSPEWDSNLGFTNYNDYISSIQTNQYAIHTWNDRDFKGTYGYFAPHWRWDVLNSPYNDAISSYRVG